MTISLYQASDELVRLLSQVDPETGELPAEFGAAYELGASRGAAVAAVIANTELQLEAYEARLKEAAKHLQDERKRMDWLRRYLLENMQRAGVTEIKSNDKLLTIKRQVERAEAVDVFDERQLPAIYMVQPEPPAPRPDKRALKDALKAGAEVPGARLVKRDRLVIK